MRSVRLRITLEILATPLYRSQNLRYPYYKEFYGYVQTFFQNVYVDEIAIHYPQSFIYDYWNQHALLAHQMVSTLQRLKLNLETHSELSVANSGIAAQQFPEAVTASLNDIRSLEIGFTEGQLVLPDGSVGTPGYVNTFVSPINLLRAKFEIGTVFKIVLQSWSLGLTDGGSAPGNPVGEAPYDESNPNGTPPAPSGDRAPNDEPYGANAPPQSPRNPDLDPNDYSDAPDPGPPPGTVLIQGWSFPALSGQSAGFAVTCPAPTLAIAYPPYSGVQQVTNLGAKPIRINGMGQASSSDILSAFPGFIFNTHLFSADTSCGVNGTADF